MSELAAAWLAAHVATPVDRTLGAGCAHHERNHDCVWSQSVLEGRGGDCASRTSVGGK